MESFAFLHHACAREEDSSHAAFRNDLNVLNDSSEALEPSPSHSSLRRDSVDQKLVRVFSIALGVAVASASNGAFATSQQSIPSQEQAAPQQQRAQDRNTRSTTRSPRNTPATSSTSQTPSARQARPSETQLLSQITDDVTLQLESTGDAVAALQQRLTDLGFYDGPIDGSFGALTEEAVIAFQEANGLPADGVVGPATTAALRGSRDSSTAASSSPTSGSSLQLDTSGEAVTTLQTRLQSLGYYDGPISGYFGPLTEEAVMAFQRANGLTADGIVGPSTEAALRGSSRPSSTASNSAPAADDGVLQVGETSPQVSGIQRRLRELGYYDGEVDGDFGSQTEQAVIAFQRSQGLTADGIVGPNTVAALERPQARPTSTTQPATQPPQSSPRPQTSPQPGVTPAPTTPPSSVSVPPPSSEPSSGQSSESFPSPTATPTPTGPASTAPSPASNGNREAVMDIQRKLQARGFYSGPIDGVMSLETQQAIDAAHQAYELNNRTDIQRDI